MEIALLVGMVAAITQVLKKWPFVNKIPAVVVSIIVSIGVVLYKALETGTPIDGSLLGILITVIITANGVFKLVKASGTPTK
jgi:hypothetical protein